MYDIICLYFVYSGWGYKASNYDFPVMLTVEDSLFMIISYLTGGSNSNFSILFNYATGFQFLYYKFF